MPIVFKEVSHAYGTHSKTVFSALQDINLEIEDKSFVAIIGETGSGKSTLVQHLNALLLPSSGEVSVDSFRVTPIKKHNKNLKQLRKKVGVVFQFPEYQLFEETILRDVSFGPKNFGMSDEEAVKKSKEMLQMVGIDTTLYEQNPFNLSGGQKRRVAIAGILAANPDVLVLDEPTAGLDPIGSVEMMSLFQNIHKNLGKTIIMVSHDMEQVYEYCERVILMKGGQVVRDCLKDEFFKDVDFLKENGIKLPFIIEVQEALKEQGIRLEEGIKDLESLSKCIANEVKKHG